MTQKGGGPPPQSIFQTTAQAAPTNPLANAVLRNAGMPYEFDSCVSTEEAFFGIEELKAGGYRSGGRSGGSRDRMAARSNP